MSLPAGQERLEQRVLILAPFGNDAPLTRRMLEEAGFDCAPCADLLELCRLLGEGAGVALITEECLGPDGLHRLGFALAGQPAWSDLPLIVFTRSGVDSPHAAQMLDTFGNVSFIERPVQVTTLISVVRAALRGRNRQYQLRAHVVERERTAQALSESQQELRGALAASQTAKEQLREFNENLEQLVARRTAEADQRAEQLRRMASVLAQTEQRERRRLAQVLHDHLQQLLVAAKLNIGLLRNRTRESTLLAPLGQVNELLDQAIGASRSLTVELSPPILYEAGLRAALEWLAERKSEKYNLIVTVEGDEEAEPENEDVRVLLFHSVRELVFNIVKHAGTDRARVRLGLDGESHITVSVIDQGKGIDDGATEGFGLLSIRERLEMIGGDLLVDSAPGRGTTVTLRAPRGPAAAESTPIPVHAPRHRVTAEPRPPREFEAGEFPASDRIRVLLADDHEILREGLVAMLQDHRDIEIVGEAWDGVMAVELARSLAPDVVVMDIAMPRLNGLEATRHIRRECPDVKVIGLSMHEEETMALAMRDAGAIAYLTKGGQAEELLIAIRGARPNPRPSTLLPAE